MCVVTDIARKYRRLQRLLPRRPHQDRLAANGRIKETLPDPLGIYPLVSNETQSSRPLCRCELIRYIVPPCLIHLTVARNLILAKIFFYKNVGFSIQNSHIFAMFLYFVACR